jgi:hypothetical protein
MLREAEAFARLIVEASVSPVPVTRCTIDQIALIWTPCLVRNWRSLL